MDSVPRIEKVTLDSTFILRSPLWGGWHNFLFFRWLIEAGHDIFVKSTVCTCVVIESHYISQFQHIFLHPYQTRDESRIVFGGIDVRQNKST